MRIPLLGGAYNSRSVIANCQKCVNWFPEVNPKDSPVPVTHYQRPGLRPLATPTTAGLGRGIWRASNGNGYCVIGSDVFQIGTNWALTKLGSITGGRTNLCSFVDNGTSGLLVDGSSAGWQITLGTGAFAAIVDATGTFRGSNRVDYIDTFVIVASPGTNQFATTNSNSLAFNALAIASKTDWPDPIQAVIVNRHEVLLIGALKSEIWYDAGNSIFPLAELPGAYIEHGTCSWASVASTDISVFWLGQDLAGAGVVWRQKGYQTSRVSNHALEVAIRKMRTANTINDAIGYCYQQDGHFFYVLTFPSGDQTWVFDDSIGEWHQRAWLDNNGVVHRDRTVAHAYINNTDVAQDWENGTLYAMDLDVYSDTVNGIERPITCIRTFPHINKVDLDGGQTQYWDGKRVQYSQFELDLDCGNTLGGTIGDLPAQVSLRYSDDRGKTFSSDVLQSAGTPGQYLTWPQWRGIGIARDRIFEISHSINGQAALNGAFIEGKVLAS